MLPSRTLGDFRSCELELKLELTSDELQRVNANPALSPVTVGSTTTQTLRSIYFDTPDQRLRAAGISLRVRSDGDAWVQTVKCGTPVVNGISHPTELEAPLHRPEPDLEAVDDSKLRRRIARLTEGSVLEPAFEIEVKRIARQLHTEKGDLELALDEGVVRAGRAEAPLCEAELELKSGDPECLLETAAKLFAGTPLRFAQASKAERGYELLYGRTSSASCRPERATDAVFPARATCRDALEALIRSATDQITANRLAVLHSDDSEGPHQLRVGLRRLRTALRAFRPLVDGPSTRELDQHAKTLAGVVGELRDADVLNEQIQPPVSGLLKGHPGLKPMKDALQSNRLAKRDAVRAALVGREWSTLQLYLSLWPLTIERLPSLQRPVAEFSDKALRQAWKGVTQWGESLDHLSEEERHEMRLALKRFRYTVEFFGPLYKRGAVQPFMQKLKELQDVFGYLNDVAQARQIEAIADSHCPGSRECQRVAGFTLGWHTARAAASWDQAQANWNRLARTRRFWR